ncbi:hypothetical protein BDZ91DRAFT_845281 [Kalaharituber pfeilii]|nr:hypothetical protein BDZ91DRAFT_845281 [Kalaharituber pfeilii]
MNTTKTCCPYCSKLYSRAGAYAEHLRKKHPEHRWKPTSERTNVFARKRRCSDTLSSSKNAKLRKRDGKDENRLERVIQQIHSAYSDFEPHNPETSMDDGSDFEEIHFNNLSPTDEEDNLGNASSDTASRTSASPSVEICERTLPFPSEYKAGVPLRQHMFRHPRNASSNIFQPFANALDYKLARFFQTSGISRFRIDEFFKDGIMAAAAENDPTYRVSFRSSHTLHKLLDSMASEPQWTEGIVKYRLEPETQFYYRNILQCTKYLLRQRAYAENMVWSPVKETDSKGEQIYNEMHTAHWWWDTQLTLPIGSTLVPILLASDVTHLTNFSGGKKLWPLYLSIGNITSRVRNMPSMNAWIPLALLPISPKRVSGIDGYSIDTQKQESLDVIHKLLAYILKPLSNPACRKGIEMVCADEQVRLCIPRVSGWLADHPENCTIHGIKSNLCTICSSPKKQLGELPEPGCEYPKRDHKAYTAAYCKSDKKGLLSDGVKYVENALWSLPDIIPHELVRADILHHLFLGITGTDHMMKWIQAFLEKHDRLVPFDYVWKRLPVYPGFHPPRKAYRSVSQWSGKEMRCIGKVVLGAFAAALRRTANQPRLTGGQKQDFDKAISCIRYLTDFMLMAQYRSHTASTIAYMEKYLRKFHEHKDVFLACRAGKEARNEAGKAKQQLASDHRLAEASERHTVAQRERLRKEHQLERQLLVEDLLGEEADFNFPKIHMLSHYADQIPRYGSLPQYSTEICETYHKLMKDAYNRSNRVDAMSQIVQIYTRDHGFAMRDKNLEAWSKELPHVKTAMESLIRPTRRVENMTADAGSPLFMKLMGKVNPEKIYSLKLIAEEYQLADLVSATRAYLQELIQTDSDIERLLSGPAELFTALQIPVPDLSDNGFILHHIRCTGRQKFRKRAPRADWAWVEMGRRTNATLKGKLPGRIEAFFKLFDRQTGNTYRCAYVSLLQCVGKGRCEGPEGMPKVRVPTPANKRVIPIRSISGMAHLIPIEPDSQWYVNNRIDLATWQDIYQADEM